MEHSKKTISRSEFQKAYFNALDEAYRPKSFLSGWSVFVFTDLTVSGALSQSTTFEDPSLCSIDVWGQDIDSSYFDFGNYTDSEIQEISEYNDGIEVTEDNLDEMYIPFSIVKHDDNIMTSFYEVIENLENEGFKFE